MASAGLLFLLLISSFLLISTFSQPAWRNQVARGYSQRNQVARGYSQRNQVARGYSQRNQVARGYSQRNQVARGYSQRNQVARGYSQRNQMARGYSQQNQVARGYSQQNQMARGYSQQNQMARGYSQQNQVARGYSQQNQVARGYSQQSQMARGSPQRNQLEGGSLTRREKAKEGAKAVGKFILKSISELRLTLLPFLGMIPGWGTLISAMANVALIGVSVVNNNVNNKPILNAIISELDSIKSKMEEYHLEHKWDTWAAGAYHRPEMDINLAWDSYMTLARALLLARSDNEVQRHVDEFVNNYPKYLDATNTLRKQLTAKGATFIYNLGEMLAQHVKCHDREIREYTVFINQLICKGNTMNQFYYKVKRIESPARLQEAANIAYDAANVLFQVQMACMANSEEYVRKDVEALIDKSKKREVLADEVRAFLEKTYDRYDWMVVAYITKHSGHRILETLNKHTMTSFYTFAHRQGVSVAVARQVKGTHSMFNNVAGAIKRCFPKQPVCYKVAEMLRVCGQGVTRDIPVSDAYTAVHAYTGAPHDSFKANIEAYSVYISRPGRTPYIYEGDCEKSRGVRGGKFAVLVKSDEEIFNKHPCTKLNCGGSRRGSCVQVKDTHVGICECNQGFYGRNCENDLADYESFLQQQSGLRVVDRRSRYRPGF